MNLGGLKHLFQSISWGGILMPEITPKLKLKKPYGNEAVNRVAYNENLELVDTNAASQDDFDNHKSAAILDHPDKSVIDVKIGERTISDGTVPSGNSGLLTSLLGGLAYMVKMITGKSDWRTAPALNLEEVRVKLGEAVPPGAVMHFARSTPPAGWLKANGAAVSRSIYSNLFAAIGTTFGAGDGSTTFNLPDLRGEFIRGWDESRGADPGRNLGSWQEDNYKSHTHDWVRSFYGDNSGMYHPNFTDRIATGCDNPTYTYGGAAIKHNGGSETRPRNISLLACIKY
jgi:microcystin-dependent protein